MIAGHGRLLAAQQLGLETVPTIELKHLTAAQRKAYVIADNRLAEDAGWDMDLLRMELGDLRDIGFDLDLTGFDPMEVDKLFGPAGGNTDPDDVPEVQAEAVSALGDVWLLGRHRLVCGDCTDAGVVEAVLDGVRPHLMVTDPPYGVEHDAAWRDACSVLAGPRSWARSPTTTQETTGARRGRFSQATCFAYVLGTASFANRRDDRAVAVVRL